MIKIMIKNYRPISLTSTICRLGERFILLEISKHLQDKQQSGFRSYRQTKDNLLNICQRNMECLNKKHLNYTIFLDISKAFDRVWQLGLLFKMKKLNFNSFIIVWLFYFFQNRIFMVIDNSILSTIFNIETGVASRGCVKPCVI